MPLAVLGAIPLVLVRVRFAAISDPDTFWHILAGKHLWTTWSFAGPDPYGSFTTHRWVLHEWLPELLLFWEYDYFGLPGVALLAFAAYLMVFLIIYRSCRQRAGMLAATLATFVGWVGAAGSLTPRPQVVSFALVALSGAVWHRTNQDLRPRWWLIAVGWVWASSHGMWFLGPMVGLAVVFGILMDGRIGLAGAARLGAIPVLSVLGAALTPVGPKLLVAPLAVNDYTKFVSEWGPPDIREIFVLATLAMIVATAVGWSRRRATSWSDILLWILALIWTLLYARTVAVGAVLLAPLFAEALQAAIRRSPEPATRWEGTVLGGGILGAVVVAAILAPRIANRPERMPTSLDGRLDALPAKTVVFNEYQVGGWLMWRHPQLKPVVDPRTELYDIAYFRHYVATRQGQPGWQMFIDQTRATTALVPQTSSLGEVLKGVLHWRETGRGDGYILLEAR
jgi:hypothetical protein